MSSELSFEASDEASENELLERSLSVWRGSCAIEWEDFTPIALDIHTACSIGHFEYVRTFIMNDGQKDGKNRGGWTPLMYACYIGHDDIVNLLIKEGCNMNMKNPRGHTPLMLAASCGNEGVARLLVRNHAQLEVIDKNGWTALFHATYAGHQNFVSFLLEVGANKDAIEPSSGITPFMIAAAEGHEIIVQLFLKHGVNVGAKAHNGDMARTLAILNGHMKVVSLIENHRLPIGSLRSEAGLESCFSDGKGFGKRKPRHGGLKSQGPSIRDGPEAIARMIDRTRLTDAPQQYIGSHIPKGYVSFPTGVGEEDKEGTKLSHRDVTSPINPEDYKDSSSSRVADWMFRRLIEFEDFNDDSNAFSKTGAITIKSSSSSSGGLVAALGLSRDSSLDSDDSHSYELTTSSSEDILDSKFGPEHSGVRQTSQNKRSNAKKGKPPEKQLGLILLSGDQENSQSKDPQDTGAPASLQSYFPYDQPFQITKQCRGDQSEGRSQALPKDNMSQAEIVNRYLKNLTRSNSEKHHNQYVGFEENQWASDEQELVSGVGDASGTQRDCAITHNFSVSEALEDFSLLSLRKENLDPSSTKESKESSDLTSALTSSDGHLVLTTNYSNSHQKDMAQILIHPPRTHLHPHLNHHHPLHSRYHHSPLSSLQDNRCVPMVGGSRMGNGQFQGPPYAYGIPQAYFCNDNTSSSNQPQFLGMNHQADLPTLPAVNPLSHLTGIFSDSSPAGRPEQALSTLPIFSSEQDPSPHLKPPTLHPAISGKVDALYCPPQATVIIPGHSTSQPVSSSFQWLDERGVGQDRPKDLNELLVQLGLTKYLDKFEEQDVDLQVFLSLTDNDLKELGIKLFGPRKKMANAIARWHSNAPIASNSLEQAYADRLEGEMQEMAIQLNQAYENEEHLKAQLLQEQQLRSVTEGCLMEERSSWEQARQTLLETRNKMRMMGELLSRLRHHQKEWKKYLEKYYRPGSTESLSVGKHPDFPSDDSSTKATPLPNDSDSANDAKGKNSTMRQTGDGGSRPEPFPGQLVKKSESCLKEMQQVLASLVQSADRILKSTHSLSISKDLT